MGLSRVCKDASWLACVGRDDVHFDGFGQRWRQGSIPARDRWSVFSDSRDFTEDTRHNDFEVWDGRRPGFSLLIFGFEGSCL